ncbi:MAG: hypothetical protein ACKV2O_23150 [Acidimicrobiales bacterium]
MVAVEVPVVSQSGEAPVRRWYNSIVQRWYLVLLWAVALVLGVVAVFVAVPTRYQASGQLLILPPAQPLAEGERRNTYLFLPDGMVLTAILLANTVNTPGLARELTDDGFTSTYTVGVVPGSGPLITITAKDVDPVQALALRDEVLERLEAELSRIQTAEGVPSSQLMEPRRFATSSQAEELAGNRIRAIIAVVVAGSILAVLSIKAVDRRTGRRVAAGEPRSSPPHPLPREQRESMRDWPPPGTHRPPSLLPAERMGETPGHAPSPEGPGRDAWFARDNRRRTGLEAGR